MTNTTKSCRRPIDTDDKLSPPVDIFQDWWLQLFGYALAALYSVYFIILYRSGTWIINGTGLPIYTDFACGRAATLQAIYGHAASLYDPAKFADAMVRLLEPAFNAEVSRQILRRYRERFAPEAVGPSYHVALFGGSSAAEDPGRRPHRPT